MNKSRLWSLARVAGAIALAGATGSAGQAPSAPPPATFGEAVDVEIVDVDIWVTDRQGRPVSGLQAKDFKLLHDGQPVEITNFVELRPAAAAAPVARPADPAAPAPVPAPPEVPGSLVLYFDQLHLQPRDYPGLLRGVAQLLAAATVPIDRVMVLRQDRDLHLEMPFGSSRQTLDAALQRIASSNPPGPAVEAEHLMGEVNQAWQESEELSSSGARGVAAAPGGDRASTSQGGARGVLGGGAQSVGSGSGGIGAGSEACDLFVDRVEGTVDNWVRERNDRTGTTLRHLFQTGVILSGLPGMKTLVYLSDALETEPAGPIAAAVGTLCPGRSLDIGQPEMPRDLIALTRHLNTNEVTVYALQASGLQVDQTSTAGSPAFTGGMRASRFSSAFESAQRTAQRQGMGSLADETGGKLVFNRNDFGAELEGIGRDMRSYYSIGYRPPAGGGAGEHRIEIALADRSLTARYRRGYREKDAEQRMREVLEGVLYLGITDNPLQVRLGAGDVRPSGDKFTLPLHVFVPVDRLAFLGAGDKPAAELKMLVLARSTSTAHQEWQTKAFRIRRQPGASGSADLAIELKLEPGTHVVAVGVRDQASRATSLVSTTLQVGGGPVGGG
jgi:VWFA-related protein